MPYPATNPTRIDALYTHWAIASLTLGSPGLARVGEASAPPIAINATLKKYFVRTDGVPEGSPHVADTIALGHPDLEALRAERPDVAAAVDALTDALMSYAAEQGKL